MISVDDEDERQGCGENEGRGAAAEEVEVWGGGGGGGGEIELKEEGGEVGATGLILICEMGGIGIEDRWMYLGPG